MKSSFTRILLACSMCCIGAAIVHADDSMSSSSSMQMSAPKAGPEAKALEKFFGANATWTGTMPAGVWGPDSKESKTHGSAMCKPVLGGMWYTCDVVDAMGTGKQAMTWKGHMLVGYDMNTKAYKGTCIDNMGAMTSFNGTLDGDTFTLETPDAVSMMGQMMKDRLTWTMNSDGTVAFTDAHQMAGSNDWVTAESATMHSMKTMAMHKSTAAKSEKMATTEGKK